MPTTPTFQANGASFNNIATQNATWPPSHVANDVGILVLHTCNQAPGNDPPTGWSLITQLGTGTAAAAGSLMVSLYGRRALSSSEVAQSVGDSGDHQGGRIISFRNCATSITEPWQALAGDVETVVGSTVTIPGGTTDRNNCLVLQVAAHSVDTDVASWDANFHGSSLDNFTSRTAVEFVSGQGGGYAAWTGSLVTAGAFSASSGSIKNDWTTARQVRFTLALLPEPDTTAPQWGQVFRVQAPRVFTTRIRGDDLVEAGHAVNTDPYTDTSEG